MNIFKFIYMPKLYFSIYNEYLNTYRKKINKIPFSIRRTASDNLPVFLKYKNNKNIVVTVIRKIKGNKEILKKEIEAICNINVIEKPDCFMIKGNHKKKIKDYFKYIGY
ncbi:mitochondrial ribosomal protein L49 precursor, putative [Plasmodium berghei]|uniref:Large ribosomal subunit protein mL49 n=2 Tax=Plasmodium berghei TaxID=5821 RepID=A0A509AQR7_PLABA|nr:mitochondrial ribosomal protein L49 precursor, putative [Plasmodium berghei ANKA]CXJ02340.1 mitochondrial ribosomal protein L49 precursor, putative [Plasmodium berghei]SCM16802.1 mitochondrial ribosomal protein L49 precursor, putative [Plasmodium berghei]SCM18600.1 mitochondrial ribosomal protein L49 precursor, putative [Plasmodium berghei]SCN28035.1 mitochondrial ribosomal protein L49 precursor, putative [Plasmodium berghei]VUC57916.1 mitochondrial ribosomal protein L49 precursor, putative|eukprot:XP_034423686.1 mitochondrial ribosomal protein L49 precursor, putative [Plasmodium berghei ANKA]